MNRAYLLIGGNLGNRKRHLSAACRMIREDCGKIMARSAIYETAAWGMEDQPAFLNQALIIETRWNAGQLLKRLLKIEKKLGRVRFEKLGPRIIDIDILFFNDDTLSLPHLKIPHPDLQHRRFVLEPLSELAPDLVHPVMKKTILTLKKKCSDRLPVKKLI